MSTVLPQTPPSQGAAPHHPVDGTVKAIGITRTPGVCGGSACIVGTRFPVWVLERSRRAGASDEMLLERHPSLNLEDLTNAWRYVLDHSKEIDAEIRENTW